MIKFTTGNLLEADVEALVNTVNTVGVMGKGIALMFKEAFPESFTEYLLACKKSEVRVGKIHVSERRNLLGGPRWILNFPTKENWRNPSKIQWIEAGLRDLRNVIRDKKIRSIAIPPLGSGNGGLNWSEVRPRIVEALHDLDDVEIIVYEPTAQYQNVAKRQGVEKLTPARALVTELVRRYVILGIECTLLEVQKLAYFLERKISASGQKNPLDLRFSANKFGPYAARLSHLLNALDGSYLHCHKRLADAGPMDPIWFDETKIDLLDVYLASECKDYLPALNETSAAIEGFESPLGMELLATVDWLFNECKTNPDVASIQRDLEKWPGGADAGARKLKLFDERLIQLAIHQLTEAAQTSSSR